MRAFCIAVAAASLATAAAAANAEMSNWASEPSHAQQLAAWPRTPAGGVAYGKAELDCDIDSKGAPNNCAAVSESPEASGIAAAALKLAPLFRAREGSEGRRRFEIGVDFDTPPEWIKKPSIQDLAAVFPKDGAGRQGRAILKCTIMATGSLHTCSVIYESPPGGGFGQAALLLTPTFIMKPATREGRPYSTEVTVPIHFEDGPKPMPNGPVIQVMREAPWSKTPSSADLMAAFPAGAQGKAAEGDVALQCDLKKTGLLRNCLTLNAAPPHLGFEEQAVRLASKFAVDPAMLAGVKGDVRVNLRIHFMPPDDPRWAERYLTKVKWAKTVDSRVVQAVFPSKAIDAGIDKGLARVNCAFQPGGALGDCRVESEDPPGLGFGASGEAVAQAFVAELWTEEGLPVEGARVRMPVRLVKGAPP